VARDRSSEVSSTPKLKGGEEDVSAVCKRQTVEGRDDYDEKWTESEVKSNTTSCSHTVGIVEGYTSSAVISNDDRQMIEGANNTALSLSFVNPESQVSPSERVVPQDSGIDHIEAGYEHRSMDVNTISTSSISGHDSTESSEGHILRQSREEVDSSVLVRMSSASVETSGAPVPALHGAVENTQKPSLAPNDLRNASLPEDTSQTSSVVTDLKGRSCSHTVRTDLTTEVSSYVASTPCLPH
jgi:hypothetical protein